MGIFILLVLSKIYDYDFRTWLHLIVIQLRHWPTGLASFQNNSKHQTLPWLLFFRTGKLTKMVVNSNYNYSTLTHLMFQNSDHVEPAAATTTRDWLGLSELGQLLHVVPDLQADKVGMELGRAFTLVCYYRNFITSLPLSRTGQADPPLPRQLFRETSWGPELKVQWDSPYHFTELKKINHWQISYSYRFCPWTPTTVVISSTKSSTKRITRCPGSSLSLLSDKQWQYSRFHERI